MQLDLLAQSVWIGMCIAAPVGPIGLLVIQRTLRHGAVKVLATVLGAAVADGLYGAVGVYGVQAIIGLLQGARLPLALLGGALLLRLAWRAWRTSQAAPTSNGATVAEAPDLLG
jgi:threonine/homoserine/homoserine lactone efflux protein